MTNNVMDKDSEFWIVEKKGEKVIWVKEVAKVNIVNDVEKPSDRSISGLVKSVFVIWKVVEAILNHLE